MNNGRLTKKEKFSKNTERHLEDDVKRRNGAQKNNTSYKFDDEKNKYNKHYVESANNSLKNNVKAIEKLKSIPGNNSITKSMNSLIELLDSKSFKYNKDMELKNILWVNYSTENRRYFELIVNKFRFKYTIEPRGSISSKNIAAWRIIIE